MTPVATPSGCTARWQTCEWRHVLTRQVLLLTISCRSSCCCSPLLVPGLHPSSDGQQTSPASFFGCSNGRVAALAITPPCGGRENVSPVKGSSPSSCRGPSLETQASIASLLAGCCWHEDSFASEAEGEEVEEEAKQAPAVLLSEAMLLAALKIGSPGKPARRALELQAAAAEAADAGSSTKAAPAEAEAASPRIPAWHPLG